MKYELVLTGRFKKGLKLAKKRGLNISLLADIVEKLLHKIPLAQKCDKYGFLNHIYRIYCGRWDLNPHVVTDTRSLVLPVCQFQHFRI